MPDEKGRFFGIISVVDLFLVVVIAAVIAVVYFNVGASGRPVVGAEQAVYVTFFAPSLENFTAHAIEIGAPVINDENGTSFGTVVSVEIGESISFQTDFRGFEVASPKENYSSVRFTSRVYGGLSDGAVVLGGNVYAVGRLFVVWAGEAKIQLQISDIQDLGAPPQTPQTF